MTSKQGQHLKYLPYAFTEQGVAMLSSVLNSERAIQVNIMIMRAFVKLKELLLTHKDLADKIAELGKKYATHDDKIQLTAQERSEYGSCIGCRGNNSKNSAD